LNLKNFFFEKKLKFLNLKNFFFELKELFDFLNLKKVRKSVSKFRHKQHPYFFKKRLFSLYSKVEKLNLKKLF